MSNLGAAILALLFFAPLAFVYGRQVAGGQHMKRAVIPAMSMAVLIIFIAAFHLVGWG